MKFIKTAAIAAGVIVLATGTGATAHSLITTHDIARGAVTSNKIADHTIRLQDLAVGLRKELTGKPGANGHDGHDGKDGWSIQGPKGDKGDAGAPGAPGASGSNGADGTWSNAGAVYRTETYLHGGGGSATVACADDATESQKYVAVSGGVQGSTISSQNPDGFAVSSSFPGRMDWDTNTPKANRLDGWIVLGNGNYTDKLVVWALCVPATSIPVVNNDLDN